MKGNWHLFQLLLLLLSIGGLSAQESKIDGVKMAVRMADSEIKQFPDPWTVDFNPKPVWNYTQGLIAQSVVQLWKVTHQQNYYTYAEKYAIHFIDSAGFILGYRPEEHNIDAVNSGKFLFDIYEKTKEPRYKKALQFLRDQLKEQPRTSEGGFWHKQRYPNQMWLDGLYMGSPFYAQFAAKFNETAAFDDVVNQFVTVHKHTYNAAIGLNYHGWDESKVQKWADPQTGCSPNFWSRAEGWYAMALVDVLDFLPQDHAGRAQLLDILKHVAAGIKKWQDPSTGLWYQVLDQGNRQGNYFEASGSSMFVYALFKAVRKGYIGQEYKATAVKGYNGIVRKLIRENNDGTISLTGCCSVAGLGGNPYRSGTYEYYINEPVRDNDPKGVGPFIMASLEYNPYLPISMSPFSDSRNHWYGIKDDGNIVNPVVNQPVYPESEILKIADNVLLYQRNNGGWAKNYDMQAILTGEQIEKLIKTKDQQHTTFDNSTTYTHVEYLAKVYTLTKIEKYKEACLKGIEFMLKAQYPNGGWPQYYPLEAKNYSSHITFNDGAYIGVMETLKKINDNDPMFAFVGNDLRSKVKNAYDKGLECLLNCQIVSKGRLTAWCQQHNEFDLKPAWARAYEMPSICNGESAQIVLFLMSIEHPSKRIIEAVQSAVKWFGESKIYNTIVKTVPAPPEKSQWRTSTFDKVVVADSTAPPIWTRFYELETERPLFSDRNSKMLYSMAEVSRERRSGYGWYTYAPQTALDKYSEWQNKWVQEHNCPKLAVSANGRYLTTDGKPFFWLGDTGWLLLGKLNREETEKYLETRRMQGFNVIQVMLLHSLSVTNSDGDSALIGKNPATPKLSWADGPKLPSNRGYWENLDFALDLAAKKGIYLALVPIWGSNVKTGHVSNKQAEAFASFLARRYRDRSNIIWLNGGDVRGDDSTQIWNTIGNTLKKEDPNHLVTFHPFGRTQSSEWFHNEAWLDFNMFQSGHRDYAQDTAKADHRYGEDNWRYVQADYNKRPVKPTLDGEPSYEGIPHGLHDTLQPRWTDIDLRRYAYWSVFSGACGFTYGNNSVMQMQKRGAKIGGYGAKEPWEQAINAPGATQMVHLKNLMQKYHFEALVPAQSILPDPGERYNYLTALKGENCLLVYTWNGRNIIVKTDQLRGSQFRYSWYSPRDGKTSIGGKVAKKEILEFDPPGTKKGGDDWVLILEKDQ